MDRQRPGPGSPQTLARAAAAVAVVAGVTLFTQVEAVSTAMASVPGLQVVSAVSMGGSSSPKSVVATCPAGKRVVGTGVYVDGAVGEVVLDDLIPGTNTVRATGYEDQDGTEESWWIRAFAVCAEPVPGLEMVTATTAASSTDKAAQATCPAGKRTLGSGAYITGGTGEVVLDTMLPADTSTYAMAYEDADGTTRNWTLTAYALCAYAPPGLETVTAATLADSENKAAWPACPSGKKALGVGWDVVASEPGRVVVHVAMPDSTQGLVAAGETGTAVGSPWSLAGRVVCATP
jgi:hypothetical protein